jgi:hypothetical protein
MGAAEKFVSKMLAKNDFVGAVPVVEGDWNQVS